MGSRAEQYAVEFEAANEALIEAVQGCADADWQKRSASEGWTVGVLAHHVAAGYAPIAGMVRTVADGGTLDQLSLADLDAINARHAQEHAHVTKQEALDALRSDGAAVAAVVRGLQDEQFARTTAAFGGSEMTVAQIVEFVAIGHPQQHLASIRAALA